VAVKKATRAEEAAKRCLAFMSRDCSRFCKIMVCSSPTSLLMLLNFNSFSVSSFLWLITALAKFRNYLMMVHLLLLKR